MNHRDKGDMVGVDHDLASVSDDRFDALVLPGGVANPDTLRTIPKAVRGRRMPSWPSPRTDRRNADAAWDDKWVVVDERLLTSRKPDDLAEFCREMVARFGAVPARHAV
jgi:protease I